MKPLVSQYSVGNSADAPPAPKRVAVFIAHGMGQQIPFQSIDVVAAGLRKQDLKAGRETPKSVGRAVKSGDQWLNRVELQLKGGTPTEPQPAVETHVYEAYWAPLTEGKVTIRDVMRFLAGAGRNGVRNARRGNFKRWLFDRHEVYPIPVRTLFYLLVALASVASLVVMNSTIAAVAAGRALLGERASWLTNVLFADLTTTFNIVVTALVAAGAAIGIGVLVRRVPGLRFVWGLISAALLTVTVFVVTLAGIALPLLFYGHIKGGPDWVVRFWPMVFPEPLVLGFDAAFTRWAWVVALAAVAVLVAMWIGKVVWGLRNDIADDGGRFHTIGVTVVFSVLVIAAVILVRRFLGVYESLPSNDTVRTMQGGTGWALLVLASAYIRQVLVQFVGDVAVYVMPYKLDAFADLRHEIHETVCKVARELYGMTEPASAKKLYDEVIVVGHSLGSVIAYDVLNHLIREDEAANHSRDIVGRTPLFITFGSPLDKTAFIFALQGRKTSEARDALAAAVQPLVRSYAHRPTRWVNIHSAWDIISGHLGFYDLREHLKKGNEHPQAVTNLKDKEASTLLVAHTEYWGNDLVFKTIYDALIPAPAAKAPPFAPGGSNRSVSPAS
ncbi:MAG: hypothetical protein ACRENU_01860 [Gemmatimonadaceae bacterium]